MVNLFDVLLQVIFAVKGTFIIRSGETLTSIVLCLVMLHTRTALLAECAGFVFKIYVQKTDPLDLRGMQGFLMALPIRGSAEARKAPRALILLYLELLSPIILAASMVFPSFAAHQGSVRAKATVGTY